MSEVIGTLGRLEGIEDGFESLADRVEGSGVGAAEQAFELGEDLFDWIEVGTIGREVKQVHACIFQALTNAGYLVCRKIVDDDGAAGPHFGDQAFFEPLLEDRARHRARQQLRGEDAVMGQAGDEGGRHPVAVRNLGEELLALLTPAVAARHRRVRAGLIDEH